MNAKSEFENAKSRINHLLLRTPRDQQTEAWVALYYAQPNTSESHVAGYVRKFNAYKAEGVGAHLTDIETLVTEMVRLAGIYRAEKSAPKVKRQPRDGLYSRYAYPTTPVRLFALGNQEIVAGTVLLLSYGNGTQPFVVRSVSGNRLDGLRLANRGTRWAGWRKSSIRRSDPRILGEAALVPTDPVLPAN